MRYIVVLFILFAMMNCSFADTLRDFTKHGIFIDTGAKKIPSKKLKYGMEIDFYPGSQSVQVGIYKEDGTEVILSTVPTSANSSCPKKIKKIGCHYTVGSRGTIHSISKKYNCMKLCR